MTQQIFDISRTITPSLAVWPGDTSFSAKTMMAKRNGDAVNLTTLTISSHTGTHVDAPYHFTDAGLTMEQVSLEPYLGPATVVTVTRSAGPLTPADFPGMDWTQVERLLVHSAASDVPLDQFREQFVYPSPELADWLGQHSILLFGTDAPSVDDTTSKTLPGHHALGRNNIAILEGLQFQNVPDGRYELIALPLKIGRGDGTPVRAVLRR